MTISTLRSALIVGLTSAALTAGVSIATADDAAPATETSPPAAAGGFKPGDSIVPKPSAPDPRPFTLQDRFFDAARRGDADMLQLCIDKGIDPKIKDELGHSALTYAIRDARSLAMAESLRARGLPVDEPDATGRSSLHDAAGNGDDAIITWLLKHGARLDRRDFQGRTPLHYAVMGEHARAVEVLLEAGADVNVRDNFQDTPLLGACGKGADEMARLLVAKGADPSLKDQEGRTPRARAFDPAPFCRSLPETKPEK